MLQRWAKAEKSQTWCVPWEQRRVDLSGFKASLDYIASSKQNKRKTVWLLERKCICKVEYQEESGGIREGRRDSQAAVSLE